jgi:hypothetical protein
MVRLPRAETERLICPCVGDQRANHTTPGSKNPDSLHRRVCNGQIGHQIPRCRSFLHGSDQNYTAVRIGYLKAHAAVNICCSWQLVCATDHFHEHGSQAWKFNAIPIFHNAEVVADMEVVDPHRVAALSRRTKRAYL